MKSKLGWVLTVLPSLLLLFSGFGKVSMSPQVLEGLPKFGIDASLARPFGIVEILCTILFLIPRTSFIGAILLTGWMGGAIFAHLRVGDPMFMQILLPIIIWLGFGLRHYNEVVPLLGLRKPH